MSNFRSKYLRELGIAPHTEMPEVALPGSLPSPPEGIISENMSFSRQQEEQLSAEASANSMLTTSGQAVDVINMRRSRSLTQGSNVDSSASQAGDGRGAKSSLLGTSAASASGLAAALAAAHAQGEVGSVGVGMFAADDDLVDMQEDRSFHEDSFVFSGGDRSRQRAFSSQFARPSSQRWGEATPGTFSGSHVSSSREPLSRQHGFATSLAYGDNSHYGGNGSRGSSRSDFGNGGAGQPGYSLPHTQAQCMPAHSLGTPSSTEQLIGGLAIGFAHAHLSSTTSSSGDAHRQLQFGHSAQGKLGQYQQRPNGTESYAALDAPSSDNWVAISPAGASRDAAAAPALWSSHNDRRNGAGSPEMLPPAGDDDDHIFPALVQPRMLPNQQQRPVNTMHLGDNKPQLSPLPFINDIFDEGVLLLGDEEFSREKYQDDDDDEVLGASSDCTPGSTPPLAARSRRNLGVITLERGGRRSTAGDATDATFRPGFVPPHILAAQQRLQMAEDTGVGQSLAAYNMRTARHLNRRI